MANTSKSKVLEFHLTGEGILPSVSVLRPTVRSSTGSPLLHFRRVLVGQSHTLPLVLINDGYLPAQVRGNTLVSILLDYNLDHLQSVLVTSDYVEKLFR